MSKISFRTKASPKEAFKSLLEKTHSLRLHMALLTSLAGAFAFLVNYFLLNLMQITGLTARYSAVILLSYGFFLFLIKLWLHYIFPKMSLFSENASDALDLIDPSSLNINLGSNSPSPFEAGQGGFSGGGASGSWTPDPSSVKSSSLSFDTAKKSGGALKEASSVLDIDGDAAVVVVPIVVVLAILALLLSLIALISSIVYFAPAILGEIAFEVAVSLGLYRGLKTALKKEEQGGSGSWIPVAIKKTAIYVIILLVVNLIVCQVIGHYYPDAHSIADILRSKVP